MTSGGAAAPGARVAGAKRWLEVSRREVEGEGRYQDANEIQRFARLKTGERFSESFDDM
jgi:hypothetical protein